LAQTLTSVAIPLEENDEIVYSLQKASDTFFILGLNVSTPLATQTNLPNKSYQVPQNSIYAGLSVDSSSIRVLELLPGVTGSVVECRLQKIDFRTKPSYEAISYVWGKNPPNSQCTIKVDDQSVMVTPNLYAALSCFRQSSMSRNLWVDAICINQDDEAEKSFQVAMMADIYKGASNVIVYLSGVSEKSPTLLQFLIRETPAEDLNTTLERLDIEKRSLLKSYLEFLSNEWWTRIWIQQEFALASNDPIFYISNHPVPSRVVWEAQKILTYELNLFSHEFGDPGSFAYLDSKAPHEITSLVVNAISVLNLRLFGKGRKNIIRYPRLYLSSSLKSKCTDLRDIVFGRHALSEPIVQHVFKTDYSKSVETLFERLAMWLLVFDMFEEVFWYYPERLSQRLPSWIPDFSKPQSTMHGHRSPRGSSFWRPTSPAIYRGVFALQGYSIDTIDQVFEAKEPSWLAQLCLLWHIDNFLLTVPRVKSDRATFPLGRLLPQIHSKFSMLQWCGALGNEEEWSGKYPEFTIMECTDILEQTFDPMQTHFLNLEYPTVTSGDMEDPYTEEQILYMERRHDEAELYARLTALQNFLVNSLTHNTKSILGAALFDHENLVDQIISLKAFNNASIHEETRTALVQLIESLAEIPEPSELRISSNPLIGSLPRITYEELQVLITDSKFAEETQLKVKWVLKVIWTIRSKLNEEGKWIGEPPSEEQAERRRNKFVQTLETVLKQAELAGEEVGEKARRQISEMIQTVKDDKVRGQDKTSLNKHNIVYQEVFSHRTFFTTPHGIVGVGINKVTDIKVGDRLIMLDHVEFPLILRPVLGASTSEDRYSIVGYANVRGFREWDFHNLNERDKGRRSVFKVI
jgi:hypothetical protein